MNNLKLTGKQKRFLRAEAHHLNPIFQVGKDGVNDNMIKQIGEALERRELIKISILQIVWRIKMKLLNH